MKTCTKCKLEKMESDFYARKKAKDGLRSTCKECLVEYRKKSVCKKNEYDKKYYLDNKAEIDARAIGYYKENKNLKKEYDLKNRKKMLALRKERYKNDIGYKLLCNLRSRLHVALKRNKKTAHTLELLGCSIDFLKTYIESKFTPDMNWEFVMNGEIHIDHIKPCFMFDLSVKEHQEECFHYTNLQPLWAADNFKKSKKWLVKDDPLKAKECNCDNPK